jgi:hypothetical protein
MIRPLKTPKMNDEKSVNYDESESEAMNLAVAAATLECRSALVNSRSAARAALTKHRSSIAHELAQALETVESYTTNEVSFTHTNPLIPTQFLHLFQFMPF